MLHASRVNYRTFIFALPIVKLMMYIFITIRNLYTNNIESFQCACYYFVK